MAALQRRVEVAYAESHASAEQGLSISGDSSAELEEQAAKVWSELHKFLALWLRKLEEFAKELVERASELLAPLVERVHFSLDRLRAELSAYLKRLEPALEEAAKHTDAAIKAVSTAAAAVLSWLSQRLSSFLDAAQPAITDSATYLTDTVTGLQQRVAMLNADIAGLSSLSAEEKQEKSKDKESPALAPPSPPSPQTVSNTVVPPADDYYVQYGPYIVAGTVVMAAVGFMVSRRALSAAASNAAPELHDVVKAGTAQMPHKKRATLNGPLQSTDAAASLVREALSLLSAAPALAPLGAPLIEGRMTGGLGAGKKRGRVQGEFSVRGPKGHAKVTLQAEKGVVVALKATLEDGTRVDIPIVTNLDPGNA